MTKKELSIEKSKVVQSKALLPLFDSLSDP